MGMRANALCARTRTRARTRHAHSLPSTSDVRRASCFGAEGLYIVPHRFACALFLARVTPVARAPLGLRHTLSARTLTRTSSSSLPHEMCVPES